MARLEFEAEECAGRVQPEYVANSTSVRLSKATDGLQASQQPTGPVFLIIGGPNKLDHLDRLPRPVQSSVFISLS